jgi:hypothetical protein
VPPVCPDTASTESFVDIFDALRGVVS